MKSLILAITLAGNIAALGQTDPAPAGGAVMAPDNSNPERDAHGVKVISDPEMELYAQYRVETSWSGMMGKDVRNGLAGALKAGIPMVKPWDGPANRVPADFLIDGDGMIRVVFYGENMAQHIPFEDVQGFLTEIGC